MQTLLGSFILPGAPGVTVCRDDQEADRFVMLPHCPLAGTDRSGAPIFHLIHAGRAGALLNLDVELAATPAEEATIRAALIGGASELDAPVSDPRLVHPDWVTGQADLTIGHSETPALRLQVTPSLFGRNRASFAAMLPMPVCKEFTAAVTRGDPPGHVRYCALLAVRGPEVALRIEATDNALAFDAALAAGKLRVSCPIEPNRALLAYAREAWRLRPLGAHRLDLPADDVLQFTVDVRVALDILLPSALLGSTVRDD
jgi:hypothetical protein